MLREENQGLEPAKRLFPATKHFKNIHVLADWAIVNKAWGENGGGRMRQAGFLTMKTCSLEKGIREPAGRQLGSRTGLSPFLPPSPRPSCLCLALWPRINCPALQGRLTLYPQWPLINHYSLISTIMSSTFPMLRLKMELIGTSSLY